MPPLKGGYGSVLLCVRQKGKKAHHQGSGKPIGKGYPGSKETVLHFEESEEGERRKTEFMKERLRREPKHHRKPVGGSIYFQTDNCKGGEVQTLYGQISPRLRLTWKGYKNTATYLKQPYRYENITKKVRRNALINVEIVPKVYGKPIESP